MINPGTPQARWFQAKIVGKFGDKVSEKRVEEKENDQDPFKNCID